MKANELKWPNSDLLMAGARTRVKELRRLVEWHTLSETDLDIVQRELDILATKINPKAVKGER